MIEVFAWILYGLAAIWLSIHDFKHHKLPNKIIYPWFVATIVLILTSSIVTSDWGQMRSALEGAAFHFLIYVILRWVSKKAVGMGDVKLAAVLGLYLGWYDLFLVPFAVVGAFVLGALYSLVGILARKLTLKSRIPFGPMMLVATALVTWIHKQGLFL